MKRMLYLFVCLLILALPISAQNQVVVGLTTEGKELKARSFEFDGRIRDYKMDTTGTFFMVKIGYLTKNEQSYKNKGELVVIDFPAGKELWKRKMNYMTDQFALLPEGVLFNSKGVKSSLLDLKTGVSKWNKKILPYILDREDNKLWAYKNGSSKKLECYEMNSGELLWTREVPHTYGWNYHGLVDDSTRLIVSDGMHLVNINNGSGESYPMITGTTNYTGAVALGALGVLTGVLTGFSAVPIGAGVNAVVELTSNVLRDDTLFYFANRTQLLCLDNQLKMKWGYPLPEDLTSHSQLFDYGERLYMINYGSGYRTNLRDLPSVYEKKMMEVNIGRPFIACFDKNTGKNIYMNQLTKKKDRIEDACLKGERNTLYLLFDDGISFCQLSDSSEIEVSSWDEKNNGKLQGFVYNSFYMENADSISFNRITPSDSASCFVYNDRYEILEIDEQMEVIRTYQPESLFFSDLNWDGYSIISRGRAQYLIVFNRKKIAELYIPFDLFVIKDRVFTLNEERTKLLEISLKELFPERIIEDPVI